MFRIILLSLSALFLCSACIGIKPSAAPQPEPVVYTMEFDGMTQLVLASETDHITFSEIVTKDIFWDLIPVSEAEIKVTSNVTYDFYVDFAEEGYSAEMNRLTKVLTFDSPPIRMKKPVFNRSEVSFPERGLFVNEEAEAIRILENLTAKFVDIGKPLLEQPRVHETCRDELETFLRGLCANLDVEVREVVINFAE